MIPGSTFSFKILCLLVYTRGELSKETFTILVYTRPMSKNKLVIQFSEAGLKLLVTNWVLNLVQSHLCHLIQCDFKMYEGQFKTQRPCFLFQIAGSTRGPRHNYPAGMRNKLMESKSKYTKA